ncbi:MAG: hypothetical protein LBM01_04170 [Christensenellaceae bacterium]|jgi:16S rRNA processing protein RimM|nr:hypothetical protein [Christensenellaceae bacterium]
MEKIEIARILKPRGLRGELKCAVLFNKIDIKDKTVFIDEKPFKVLSASVQNGFLFIMLEGVSLEIAEKLRDKIISIPASEVKLERDEILTSDLIGFAVVGDKGKNFGRVIGFDFIGDSDIIITPLAQIPNEDFFVLETNMATKTITVNEDALDEITVL